MTIIDAKTKIILADDQHEVRSALKLLLEQEPAWEIVGECRDAEDLIKTIQKGCPDVVLLDWELPNMQVTEHMTKMRACCSEMKVVALSSQIESRNGALKANVDAFLSKGDPPNTVLDTLHTVLSPPQEKLKKGKKDR
jgi:two-component system response regulator DesR